MLNCVTIIFGWQATDNARLGFSQSQEAVVNRVLSPGNLSSVASGCGSGTSAVKWRSTTEHGQSGEIAKVERLPFNPLPQARSISFLAFGNGLNDTVVCSSAALVCRSARGPHR